MHRCTPRVTDRACPGVDRADYRSRESGEFGAWRAGKHPRGRGPHRGRPAHGDAGDRWRLDHLATTRVGPSREHRGRHSPLDRIGELQGRRRATPTPGSDRGRCGALPERRRAGEGRPVLPTTEEAHSGSGGVPGAGTPGGSRTPLRVCGLLGRGRRLPLPARLRAGGRRALRAGRPARQGSGDSQLHRRCRERGPPLRPREHGCRVGGGPVAGARSLAGRAAQGRRAVRGIGRDLARRRLLDRGRRAAPRRRSLRGEGRVCAGRGDLCPRRRLVARGASPRESPRDREGARRIRARGKPDASRRHGLETGPPPRRRAQLLRARRLRTRRGRPAGHSGRLGESPPRSPAARAHLPREGALRSLSRHLATDPT